MRPGISAVAMAAAIVLGGNACGGSSDDQNDNGSGNGSAKDPASLSGTVIYWDTSDARNEAPTYQALIKDFEAKYPKMEVTYPNVDFTTVEQKFKAAAQSGKGAPDVIRADVGLIPEYASLHRVAPLDGTTALPDSQDFVAGPLETTTYEAKTYAVPSVTDTPVRAGGQPLPALDAQPGDRGRGHHRAGRADRLQRRLRDLPDEVPRSPVADLGLPADASSPCSSSAIW